VTVVGLILIGLVAGALAASLGVGGGIVYVPALVTLFAFAQHEAQGTSLAVIIPTALLAATIHGRAGRVDWRTAILLGCGGIIGGLLGAGTALSLEAPVLRRMFAVFLIVMAIRMLRRTTRAAHHGDDTTS
jgi:uncharacterized membrane protein YfcA